MADWITTLGYVAATVVGVPYLIGPIMIRAGVRPLITAAIAPDPDPPPELAATYARQEAALAAVGFTPAGRYQVRTNAEGEAARAAVMRGPNGATLAMIAAVKGPKGWVEYVELGTRFRGAGDVYLGNTAEGGIFVDHPANWKAHAPELPDAAALWATYRRVVARERAGLQAIRIPPGLEAQMMRDGIAKAIAYQAEIGHYRPDGELYRLTWWGAYRSAWLLLWPLKPIRARMLRARYRRLLAAAG